MTETDIRNGNPPNVRQTRAQLLIKLIHVYRKEHNDGQRAHSGRGVGQFNVQGQAALRRVALHVMVRLVPPVLHVGERLGRDDHGLALPEPVDVLFHRHGERALQN